MARVKYGALITEIKGKVGGTVFQAGRSGGVMKNKPAGRNYNSIKNSTETSPQRSRFSTVTKQWSKISAVQRASWDALLGVYQFVNKFGDVYNGSAYQIYVSANLNLLICNKAMIATAPVLTPALDPDYVVSDYSLGGVFTIKFQNALAVGQLVFIQYSRPVHPTIAASKVEYPFSQEKTIVSAVPVDLKTPYEAFLGFPPAQGSVIYVKIWTMLEKYPKAQFKEVFIPPVIP